MDHFDKATIGQNKFLMYLRTLASNPVAAVAGLTTIEILRREGSYTRLLENGQRLMDMITRISAADGLAHEILEHLTLQKR